MAAKLEWVGAYLFKDYTAKAMFCDALGEVRSLNDGMAYNYVTRLNGRTERSSPYERKQDAYQDCESEVRRLLEEAGIEVEP